MDLVDDLCPGGVSRLDEVARIAEGQRHHCRLGFEGGFEGMFVE